MIHHMTHTDVPLQLRQRTAKEACTKLKEKLSDPTLSQAQRRVLRAQLTKIEEWGS